MRNKKKQTHLTQKQGKTQAGELDGELDGITLGHRIPEIEGFGKNESETSYHNLPPPWRLG